MRVCMPVEYSALLPQFGQFRRTGRPNESRKPHQASADTITLHVAGPIRCVTGAMYRLNRFPVTRQQRRSLPNRFVQIRNGQSLTMMQGKKVFLITAFPELRQRSARWLTAASAIAPKGIPIPESRKRPCTS